MGAGPTAAVSGRATMGAFASAGDADTTGPTGIFLGYLGAPQDRIATEIRCLVAQPLVS